MRQSTQQPIQRSLRPSLTSNREHRLENGQATSWPPPWATPLQTTDHGLILKWLSRNNLYPLRHRYKQLPKCTPAKWGTEISMNGSRNGANMPSKLISMMLPRCLPSTTISMAPSIRRWCFWHPSLPHSQLWLRKLEILIITGDFMWDQEILIEVHHAAEITMHESVKSPLRKLQMWRLTPPEVAPLSRNKAVLLSWKGNIAWTTTFASIAAKPDIRP